jgi:hypothetical protein
LAPWLGCADGVTVTGGEPFDQPGALETLLRGLRTAFDGDLLIYSGYPRERIAGPLAGLAGLIDALVTDPYVAEACDRLPLRGSDNQRLHLLTPRRHALYARLDTPGEHAKPRALDLMLVAPTAPPSGARVASGAQLWVTHDRGPLSFPRPGLDWVSHVRLAPLVSACRPLQ